MSSLATRGFAVLAALLIAPRAVPAQEDAVQKGLQTAKIALERKEDETAVLELRGVEAALEGVPSTTRRTTLRNQLVSLLRRADPRYAARAKACDAAAKALVKAAKGYGAKGWHRTSLELLEIGAHLAPMQATAARDEALLAVTKASEPGGASDAAAFFAKATQPFRSEGLWQREGEEIVSPTHTQPLPTLLLSATPIEARDYFVEVDARTEGEPGQLSIAFAHRSDSEFALLELFHLHRDAKNPLALSEQRFLLLEGGPQRVLGTTYPSLSPRERRDWIRLRVEVRGAEIRGLVGGFSVLEARVPERPLQGRFGLFIASASEWKGVTRFKNLRWGVLGPAPVKK